MDKLTSMQVFARVAQAGSFAAAAEQLNMSRAMVTKHVAHLENSIGVRLLNRTTRRLSLTEEGRAYRERCVQILEEVEETEAAVSQLSAQPRGTLRLTAPTSFGTYHLAPAAADYMARYPEVDIDLTLFDRWADLAEEGLDLGIRVGRMEDSNLIARPLAQARMVVCGAPSYFERHGIPEHPEDLVHHNCLRYALRMPQDLWQFHGPDGPVAVRINGNLRSDVGDALRLAALAGLGLVLQPSYMLGKEIKAGRLRVVLPDFEPTPASIYAVYLHRRHLSAKVRTFVEFLQQRFQPRPYWEEW